MFFCLRSTLLITAAVRNDKLCIREPPGTIIHQTETAKLDRKNLKNLKNPDCGR